MKNTFTAKDLICAKCGILINYQCEEIIWNAAGNPLHRSCFLEPRNLAKPNAQPALDVVAIKAVDFNHLLVQLNTMSILVHEDNFRADNRATFERMIKALQKELSKYQSNDV